MDENLNDSISDSSTQTKAKISPIIIILIIIVVGASIFVFATGDNTEKNLSEGDTPSLDVELIPHSEYTEDINTAIIENIEKTRDEIRQDLSNASNWIVLGNLHKILRDIENAEIYYKYAIEISDNSTDEVAHNNLADLYAYDLRDFEKAEYYFKEAIRLADNKEAYQRSLNDF